MKVFNKCAPWLLGAAFSLSLAQAYSANYVDVLDMPAKQSELARQGALRDVVRAGERLVSVGARGHILYSDNNGQSWQQASVPVSADLNAVHFPTAEQGWAVGNDGVILHSSDGGRSWLKQLDGRDIGASVLAHYQALAQAAEDQEVWAYWLEEAQRLVDEGADKPFLDVLFTDAQTGYVVGVFNLILQTQDGGISWQPIMERTDNPMSLHLTSLNAVGNDLYIVGEQGLLLRWTAAKQRFVALPTDYQGTLFGVIGYADEVLTYGLRGYVFRSTDDGATWQQVETGSSASITAATVDAAGKLRLFSQTGHSLELPEGSARFVLADKQALAPTTAAVIGAAGELVLVGERGVRVQTP